MTPKSEDLRRYERQREMNEIEELFKQVRERDSIKNLEVWSTKFNDLALYGEKIPWKYFKRHLVWLCDFSHKVIFEGEVVSKGKYLFVVVGKDIIRFMSPAEFYSEFGATKNPWRSRVK